MRNFFVGLILTFEKSKNIQIDQYLNFKLFTEEISYVFTSSNSSNHGDSDSKNNKISITGDEELRVEVTEYAPKVFKRIREIEGISEEDIMESLNPMNNTKIIESQGKSSSFFISTDDSRLLVKTLKKEEFDVIFDKFLIFYVNYIQNNKFSLICRIYGVFKVTASSDADPLLIIVMRDAYGPLKRFITKTFDLKGSQIGRETKLSKINLHDPLIARKDINFLNEEIKLKIQNRQSFIENITRDAMFFEDFNLMDYSMLLLKLEFNNEAITNFIKFNDSIDHQFYKRHIYQSSENRNVFYLCFIIDYLQDYNFRKKMENNIKNFITERPNKTDMISCVPPQNYSMRFIEFFTNITE